MLDLISFIFWKGFFSWLKNKKPSWIYKKTRLILKMEKIKKKQKKTKTSLWLNGRNISLPGHMKLIHCTQLYLNLINFLKKEMNF